MRVQKCLFFLMKPVNIIPMAKSKLVEIKTKPTENNVEDFINALADENKRRDSLYLLNLFKQITGEEPKLWGNSVIGFGQKRYKSPATGREVDWFKIGFSPRKTSLSLHLMASLNQDADAFKSLGKHKTGVGCLYINKLSDVNLQVLEHMIITAAKEGSE